MLIGFAGFFGVVFLVVTIACELTGRPALGWALTLLFLVVLVGVLLRQRRAIVRAGQEARSASDAAVTRGGREARSRSGAPVPHDDGSRAAGGDHPAARADVRDR